MDLLIKIYTVADGREKYGPTAAIFPQKCGRWYFENADGRENTGKPRPLETQNAFHRARYQSKNALPPTQSV